MHGNVDTALLQLRLLSKYLIKEYGMRRRQEDSYIFYNKYDGGKLELMMSVHVDNVVMLVRPEILESIKYMIKLKFNIQESVKVKKFI